MEQTKKHSPAGGHAFVPVPISEDQHQAALQLCVMLQREGDSAGLVVLRHTLDARVVLGCIVDESDQVHRWVELWLQDIDGYAAAPAAGRAMMNNHLLDQQWTQRAAALASAETGDVIRGPWERNHPQPSLIDLQTAKVVHPADESGQPWQLCTDDLLLNQHDLPPYSTSLHRYLVAQRSDGPVFAALTSEAPTGDAAVGMESIVDGHLPLNVGGGLMMVRTHEPLSYDQFIDLLSGAEVAVTASSSALNGRLASVVRAAGSDVRDSGRLFLGRQARSARLLETFHLKLRAIIDAVVAVQSFVQVTQAPVLDLRSEHFRVRLGPAGRGLPALWCAQSFLADPAQAIRVPFEATAHRYFLPHEPGASIYKVSASTRSVQGRGSMRLRQVIEEGKGSASGGYILEGTFTTQERIEPASGDLLWMRIPLGSARLDVHATLDAESALAAGEWRFRTHAREFDDQQRQLLRQMEGVPVENILFDLVPLLSTPCDLYALAVLATRTLLVDDETTLAVAVDEVHSLARQLASTYDEQTPLPERIRAVFAADDRWTAGIGPHRLVREKLAPDDAVAAIPMDLWFRALGVIVAALPGAGPDSFSRSLGDVSPGALHQAFEPMVEELELLIGRTRSLVTADWRANREIHAVARQLGAAEPS